MLARRGRIFQVIADFVAAVTGICRCIGRGARVPFQYTLKERDDGMCRIFHSAVVGMDFFLMWAVVVNGYRGSHNSTAVFAKKGTLLPGLLHTLGCQWGDSGAYSFEKSEIQFKSSNKVTFSFRCQLRLVCFFLCFFGENFLKNLVENLSCS